MPAVGRLVVGVANSVPIVTGFGAPFAIAGMFTTIFVINLQRRLIAFSSLANLQDPLNPLPHVPGVSGNGGIELSWGIRIICINLENSFGLEPLTQNFSVPYNGNGYNRELYG